MSPGRPARLHVGTPDGVRSGRLTGPHPAGQSERTTVMRSMRRLTDAEREQRREQDRQRLHEAANRLLTSEGWRRWVRMRARGGLARLSLNNQLLIALSCPDATFVAGFKAWLSLGYCVRKGETAIRIIAPMLVKARRADVVDGDTAGDARPRVPFEAVSVFDRSQVAPLDGVEQIPLEPPCEPLTGDSHAHLLAPLQAFTESRGFTVAFESIPGATGGWCDQKERRIVVDGGQSANARLRILIHRSLSSPVRRLAFEFSERPPSCRLAC